MTSVPMSIKWESCWMANRWNAHHASTKLNSATYASFSSLQDSDSPKSTTLNALSHLAEKCISLSLNGRFLSSQIYCVESRTRPCHCSSTAAKIDPHSMNRGITFPCMVVKNWCSALCVNQCRTNHPRCWSWKQTASMSKELLACCWR